MPVLGCKVYSPRPAPRDLKSDEEVFVFQQTGELFRSYDDYISKVILFGSQSWTCQYTGQTKLTYTEANSSEEKALRRLEDFPTCFAKPVLDVVHHSVLHLDALVNVCVKQLLQGGFLVGQIVEFRNNGKLLKGKIVKLHDISDASNSTNKSGSPSSDKENSSLLSENGLPSKTTSKLTEQQYDICMGPDSEDVLLNVPHEKIRHVKKLPSKDLLRIFIRANTKHRSEQDPNPWIVKKELVEEHSIADKLSDFNFAVKQGSKADSNKKRRVSQLKSKQRKLDPTQKTLNFTSLSNQDALEGNTAKKSGTKRCAVQSSLTGKGNQISPKKCVVSLDTLSQGQISSATNSPAKVKLLQLSQHEGTAFSVGASPSQAVGKCPRVKLLQTPPKKTKKGKKKVVVSSRESFHNTSKAKGEIKTNAGGAKRKLSNQKSQQASADKESPRPETELAITLGNKAKKIKTSKSGDGNEVVDLTKKNNGTMERTTGKHQPSQKLKQATMFDMTKQTPNKSQMKATDKRNTEPEMKCLNADELLKRLEEVAEKRRQQKAELRQQFLEQTRKCEDTELQDLKPLPSPKPACVPEQLSVGSYGDVVMLVDLVHAFPSLLVPNETFTTTADSLMQALVAGNEGFPIVSQMLLIFLQILVQDRSTKGREMGRCLSDMPLTQHTASELTRLYLKSNTSLDYPTEITNIVEALQCKEFYTLAAQDKLTVLVALCQEVVCSTATIRKHQRQEVVERRKTLRDISDDLLLGLKQKKLSQTRECEINEKEETQEAGKKEEGKEAAVNVSDDTHKENEVEEGLKNLHPEKNTEEAGKKEGKEAALNASDDTHKENEIEEGLKNLHPGKNTEETETKTQGGMSVYEIVLQKEKERKQQQEKKRREKEERKARELQRQAAIRRCKNALRRMPLGCDRFRQRYWLFPSTVCGLLVESDWMIKEHDFDHMFESRNEADNTKKMETSSPAMTKREGASHDEDVSAGDDVSQIIELENTSDAVKSLCSSPAAKERADQVDDSFVSAVEDIDNANEAREPVNTENTEKRNTPCAWYCYDNVEDIKNLIRCLAPRGFRESALLSTLKDRMSVITSNIEARVTTDSLAQTEKGDEILLKALKEDLASTANRLMTGSLGSLDVETYEAEVANASTVEHFRSLLLQLQSAVLSRFLRETSKKATADWLEAVGQAQTLSRLHLLFGILDSCVVWRKSAENVICKICRRSGRNGTLILCDDCKQGYHLLCFRPALSSVPEGHWSCASCTMKRRNRRSRIMYCDDKSDNENSGDEELSVLDEESSGPEADDRHEDTCYTCEMGGDELVCCDTCPLVFHRECHDPPLRNIPRGIWNCHVCQKPKVKRTKRATRKRKRAQVTKAKRRKSTSPDEDSDDDIVISKKRKGSRNVKSANVSGRNTRAKNRAARSILEDENEESEEESEENNKEESEENNKEESEEKSEDESSETKSSSSESSVLATRRTRVGAVKGKNAFKGSRTTQKNNTKIAKSATSRNPPRAAKGNNRARITRRRAVESDSNSDSTSASSKSRGKVSKGVDGNRNRRKERSGDENATNRPRRACRDSEESGSQARESDRRTGKESQKGRTQKRSPPKHSTEQPSTRRSGRSGRQPRMEACEVILNDLILSEDSWPFREPVNPIEIPDYRKFVSDPMDLSTVKDKLHSLQYLDAESFVADIRLMFYNGDKYNLATSEVGQAGIFLENHFEELLEVKLPDLCKQSTDEEN